ncbi:MAG: 3-dehydroquinate synthase [Gemmatimonadaceae bacterium]|nr:3-dehydroquinate synthase [Gemmatimonadaceae bacterium]
MTTPFELRAGLFSDAAARIRAALPERRLAIISDSNVGPLYGAALAASLDAPLLTIAAGEASKTRDEWARLTDALLAAGFGRDSAIVAVGGGVVGDLAGFVAATYLRGIPVVQVPTSLIAMIDSAIGGKTGVDTPHGKNLVGAFHAPSLILVDPDLLRTLPLAHRRAGLAEAIKHGVIADEGYFHWLASHGAALLTLDGAAATRLVEQSIAIKQAIVASDPFEHGRRRILNFGHTIGHALEHESGYRLLHGEAVALGMLAEARLAERTDHALPGLADEVYALLASVGVPTRLPMRLDAAAVVQRTYGDKKAHGGVVHYALAQSVGVMAGETQGWRVAVQDGDALAAVESIAAA